jgi:hypothetical protein
VLGPIATRFGRAVGNAFCVPDTPQVGTTDTARYLPSSRTHSAPTRAIRGLGEPRVEGLQHPGEFQGA